MSSPVLGRRAAPLAEALVTSAKLNLLEEKLKQELSAGRLIMWVDEDEIKWELIFERRHSFYWWILNIEDDFDFFSGKVRESQRKYLNLMLKVNRVQVSQKIRDKNVDACCKRGAPSKKSPWFISALFLVTFVSIDCDKILDIWSIETVKRLHSYHILWTSHFKIMSTYLLKVLEYLSNYVFVKSLLNKNQWNKILKSLHPFIISMKRLPPWLNWNWTLIDV